MENHIPEKDYKGLGFRSPAENVRFRGLLNWLFGWILDAENPNKPLKCLVCGAGPGRLWKNEADLSGRTWFCCNHSGMINRSEDYTIGNEI